MNLSRHIVLRTLRDKRIAIFSFSASMFIILFIYLSFFALLGGQSAHVEQLLKQMPSWYFSDLNINPTATLQTVQGFLIGQIYGVLWPIITGIFMIYFAGSMVAGEAEQGSLGLLLTLPLSRRQIITSKYAAGIIALSIFVFATVLAMIPTVSAYGYDIRPGHFWVLAILAWFAGWLIYSFAFMLSCIFSKRSQVFLVAGGTMAGMYLVSNLASAGDFSSVLRFLSFFYYYDPQSALAYGEISHYAVLIFGLLAFYCTKVGIRRFLNRDYYI
jgi:ABC-2 type transport system permease protein